MAARMGRMHGRILTHKFARMRARPTERAPAFAVGSAPQNGPSYVGAFMSALLGVTKEQAVQYWLALMVQMLAGEGTQHS